jgi:hypothetical protein
MAVAAMMALSVSACSARRGAVFDVSAPELRAVEYLAHEVPSWPKENGCFSCHNSGDGARSLFAARQRGVAVPEAALAATSEWLAKPAEWDRGQGDERYQDPRLSRVQFATALLAAIDAAATAEDRARYEEALAAAARLVAEVQREDGSWRIEPEGTVGSPVTYGAVLATHLAHRVLVRAGEAEHKDAIVRAEKWVSKVEPRSVLDAAALVLALRDVRGDWDPTRAAERLAILRRGQSRTGGWGPYPDAPPEPFDTAIALLALAPLAEEPEWRDVVRRGREFLVAAQETNGSWQETTRPAGGDSYAQHISTTAWAAMALLETGR